MAAIRGTLQGNRGEVSRLGSAASGMTATLNTWNVDVRVHLTADDRLTVEVQPYGRGRRVEVLDVDAADVVGGAA